MYVPFDPYVLAQLQGLALAFMSLMSTTLLLALFRLRRRHRACRHALSSSAKERDHARLQRDQVLARLKRYEPNAALGTSDLPL